MLLYATAAGQFGSMVDYSGRQRHTKHSTISVHHPSQATEYVIPRDYHTAGVQVSSSVLQRVLREYKTLSKRIILTGNESYVHLSADTRVSLHRSENLIGSPKPREDDVSVELSISTLGRILKVTNFSPQIRIVCEPVFSQAYRTGMPGKSCGQPVLLTTPLAMPSGSGASHVDVFVQPEVPVAEP